MTPFPCVWEAYERLDRCQFAHVDNLWMIRLKIGTDVCETAEPVDN